MSGKFKALNTISVCSDSTKTIQFIKGEIESLTSMRRHIVVFLGETHHDPVDEEVTKAILEEPPIVAPDRTRVILERMLDHKYYPSTTVFDSVRTESMDPNKTKKERSHKLAAMVLDAWRHHDMWVVYVVCGSAHGVEIYNNLNKKSEKKFTFLYKPSSQD